MSIHKEKIEKLSNSAHLFYAPFPKKTGVKPRIIDNPTGLLKEVQKRINDRILAEISFPNFVIGGVKGRKPYEHPQRHINKPVVVTLDVKSCFPNITNKQVFNVWHKQLRCSSEVARIATKLTTRNGHLPLGASTSVCLANLTLQSCLTRVVKIAKDNGFSDDSIGQYIDDLALSGYILPKDFIVSIIKEFQRHGIKIGRDKIKVMRSNEPQIVTKKVVNRKVSIPLKERNRIRAALHEMENMDPRDETFAKKYRSLQGRINNLGDFHSALAQKMWGKFNRFTNPDKRK